jgi:hypothetical protein
LGLPKMKHHIMTRRTYRYPWIFSCWIAYFVRNIDMVYLSLQFWQARNNRRVHELISPYVGLSNDAHGCSAYSMPTQRLIVL